jgi:hypothetical protein
MIFPRSAYATIKTYILQLSKWLWGQLMEMRQNADFIRSRSAQWRQFFKPFKSQQFNCFFIMTWRWKANKFAAAVISIVCSELESVSQIHLTIFPPLLKIGRDHRASAKLCCFGCEQTNSHNRCNNSYTEQCSLLHNARSVA